MHIAYEKLRVDENCLFHFQEFVQERFDSPLHVHDEVVLILNKKTAEEDLAKAIEIMSEVPKWAEGLPINAEGKLSDPSEFDSLLDKDAYLKTLKG